ncbi:hypothetical protein H2LOC_017625 [Methylocystis heyeri]|uniref:Uncharacterized protein n=1 Tax=Methylocystis heyeri TaxID=391905 RepID=A0A6B8KI59_9HYPH|nr:hypothetical protein H2LOC_017625 [Methylocystis heyeri]
MKKAAPNRSRVMLRAREEIWGVSLSPRRDDRACAVSAPGRVWSKAERGPKVIFQCGPAAQHRAVSAPACDFHPPGENFAGAKTISGKHVGTQAASRLEKPPSAGVRNEDQINIVFTLKTLN